MFASPRIKTAELNRELSMKYVVVYTNNRTNAGANKDAAADAPPLAFEAEFDGIRRSVSRTPEPLFNPNRYWELKSGGTD